MNGLRILGMSVDNVHDGRFRTSETRVSGLWKALENRGELVGLVNPSLPPAVMLGLRVMARFSSRDRRFSRMFFRRWAYDLRGRQASKDPLLVAGDFHGLICEGFFYSVPSLARPYVIYSDATLALVERYYPKSLHFRLGSGAWRRFSKREAECYHRARWAIGFSEFCRQSYVSDYYCDPARTAVVRPGVKLKPRAKVFSSGATPTALFVGYDFKRKGGYALVDAWRGVQQRFPAAKLLVVGPEQALAERPGIEWLGRLNDRQKLAELYRKCDVFVMPSIFEAYGHVFLEAMSQGVPCIGPDRGAFPEIGGGADCGWIVDPSMPTSIGAALEAVFADRRSAFAKGERALQRAQVFPTWDGTAETLGNIFRNSMRYGAQYPPRGDLL